MVARLDLAFLCASAHEDVARERESPSSQTGTRCRRDVSDGALGRPFRGPGSARDVDRWRVGILGWSLSIVPVHTLPTVVRDRSLELLPGVRDVSEILIILYMIRVGKRTRG